MGRPKETTYTETIWVRVTPEMRARLEKLAGPYGKISTVAREAIEVGLPELET